jgi:hypothetical protein
VGDFFAKIMLYKLQQKFAILISAYTSHWYVLLAHLFVYGVLGDAVVVVFCGTLAANFLASSGDGTSTPDLRIAIPIIHAPPVHFPSAVMCAGYGLLAARSGTC